MKGNRGSIWGSTWRGRKDLLTTNIISVIIVIIIAVVVVEIESVLLILVIVIKISSSIRIQNHRNEDRIFQSTSNGTRKNWIGELTFKGQRRRNYRLGLYV